MERFSFNRILFYMAIMQIYSTSVSSLENLESSVSNLVKSIVSSLPPILPISNITTSNFENWAQDIEVKNLPTVYPKTTDDLLSIVQYAITNNLKLRVSGNMATWSPLTVTQTQNISNTLLVKTSGLDKMAMVYNNSQFAYFKVQTGALMNDFLKYMESAGYGLTNLPGNGYVTIGGVIAVGAHGASFPTTKQQNENLFAFGSVSNSILCLTALIYDNSTRNYTLKNFTRQDPEISALMVNLGKALILDVTLKVLAIKNVRCESLTNVPNSELFANPATANATTRTFTKFMKCSLAFEVILYPFTNTAWLKKWTIYDPSNSDLSCSTLHLNKESRQVSSPYNYVFTDEFPLSGLLSTLVSLMMNGYPEITPYFGQEMLELTNIGLDAPLIPSRDIWGPSNNVFLFIKPTTFRYEENGYAILVNSNNVQLAVFTIMTKFNKLIEKYQAEGLYPINGPVEIRVSGLDSTVGLDGGSKFSNVGPLTLPQFDNDYNCSIWIDVLTFKGTNYSAKFYTEFQKFMLDTFNGTGGLGLARPEWSKKWAYTHDGAYLNNSILNSGIPNMYNYTYWNTFVNTLKNLDPLNLYSNGFLDNLVKEYSG